MTYPHKEFIYKGIKVVIGCFTNNAGTIIHDYAAAFYQEDIRLLVNTSGWNFLIRSNMEDCIQDSKRYIDARLENDGLKVEQFHID